MENGSTKEKIRSDGEVFANSVSDEIINCKEINEIEQIEIIRHLENLILHMVDEMYAEQESQYDEMMRDDDGGEQEEDANFEQRVFEFQRMIE